MATEVVIPMLGVTVENGKIVEWLKQENDPVEKGESIFVVEADKVTTEVESPASGILAKILLAAGQEVPVLSLVAVITDPGEVIPDKYVQLQERGDGGVHVATADAVQEGEARRADSPAAISAPGQIKVVPAARKLAKDNGIDLQSVQPTGPEGTITYRDVQNYKKPDAGKPAQRVSTLAGRKARAEDIALDGVQGSGVRGRIMVTDLERSEQRPGPKSRNDQTAADVDADFGKVIPMDGIRSAIARRLTGSAFTAPHVAFYTDVHMGALLAYRSTILSQFERKFAVRPSINDFLLKAVALTIREFPLFNATLVNNEIHVMPSINVGLAVALPNGLVVPSLTDVDQQGLAEMVIQRKNLVERALAGKLTMEEMERGTFTVSSLAQFEVTFFTSIINPPQSAILSVGKTREELALIEGEVRIRKVSTMGVAVDHRIIDGAMAANFIQTLKQKLEHPSFTFMHC
ncbi:MAG: dihydrolipoamide acetyltransferase family protein [Desulfopila sp.]